MEIYGTSNVLPMWYGEQSHAFTFDQDIGLLEMQILVMKDRGTEAVRDNNVTGIALYNGNNQAGRDELLDYYCDAFCPTLLNRGIFPFPVLFDRNWLGDWSGSSGFAGMSALQVAAIYSRAGSSQDVAARIAINLAIFGTDSGGLCTALRAAILDEIEEFAGRLPYGVWMQAFNGPETTRVCGQFGTAFWDFTPDAMHSITNTSPAANRAWALSALGVTMEANEAQYLLKEAAFLEDVMKLVEAAGHPRNRVITGGIHSYILATTGKEVRSLRTSDPNDFDTFPENAVISEWSVPRWNGIPLNDPDVVPRPLLGHFSNLLAKKPRAMFLHSPTDGRQLNLWQTDRSTIDNWTPDGFKLYLTQNSKDPEPYNALPLLEDEPRLLDDMREAAALFRRYRDLRA